MKPIWRFSEHFQNDWAARADWCVKSPEDANHNPMVVVNGSTGKDVVRLAANPGETVVLDADGTSDPDGDMLGYTWWYYADPSSYREEVEIEGAMTPRARFEVPYACQAHQYHLVLTVRDDGEPNLFAYRRVVIEAHAAEDATPPSRPATLGAKARNETTVELRWDGAADPESGVRRYVIYRDGESVGETPTRASSDSTVREATAYTYSVTAVNGCSLEGATSTAVRIFTPPDQTPLAIASVRAAAKTVAVTFDEPLERASAENTAHWTIDPEVAISAATLGADGRTVVLRPAALIDGKQYTLSVRNVRDGARSPNTIAANSTVSFRYRDLAPLVRVSAPGDETPLTLHGEIDRGPDGSFVLANRPPWRWITVGPDGEPLPTLERLRSFTILGWAKAASLATGSGGNRIAFNLNYDRSGFDLVHLDDGRLRLAVNEWPDRVRNDSSPGRIRTGEWVFFAVSYDGTKERDNVHWYFGSEGMPTLDRTTTYPKGPTGAGSGPLTIGNYNATIHRHGTDRQFRGELRGIAIFGSSSGADGALDLASIRVFQ